MKYINSLFLVLLLQLSYSQEKIKVDGISSVVGDFIILDSDILSSLMFGHEVGVKLARRLNHEIRYNQGSENLFLNFLQLLGDKCLYLDYSKNSC